MLIRNAKLATPFVSISSLGIPVPKCNSRGPIQCPLDLVFLVFKRLRGASEQTGFAGSFFSSWGLTVALVACFTGLDAGY